VTFNSIYGYCNCSVKPLRVIQLLHPCRGEVGGNEAMRAAIPRAPLPDSLPILHAACASMPKPRPLVGLSRVYPRARSLRA
jgi:hypothetical protein